MASKNSTFEVQIFQHDHWVVADSHPREDAARDHAQRLLLKGTVEGVRVVRDWKRADGKHIETELFTQFRKSTPKITIPTIDEAPLCHVPDDYYRVESRITIGRVLRPYLDSIVLSPIELLHNYTELKRLRDTGTLLPAAVHRVAAAQVKGGGDVSSRRDDIFGIVEAATRRARQAANLPEMAGTSELGFADAYDRLSVCSAAEELSYLAQMVLCGRLTQTRNWLGKLDTLTTLVETDGLHGVEPLGILDAALADVVGVPPVIQEILGPQRNLADALCRVADLAEGIMAPNGSKPADRNHRLADLIAAGGLVETQAVLIDLLRRQLKGGQPLVRDTAEESTAFDRVRCHLIRSTGVLGGPAMAEALTLRQMRFLEAGGETGRRQAIADLTDRFTDKKERLHYLLALGGSDLGRQFQDDVLGQLEGLTGAGTGADQFLNGESPKPALATLTSLYDAVHRSRLPDDSKTLIGRNLDTAIAGYIVDHRIVEAIDDPQLSLRNRANRLVEFCAPGVLRSEEALGILRRRVIDHLRRPNFDAEYVRDLPDATARQRALREFYGLLAKAGFL